MIIIRRSRSPHRLHNIIIDRWDDASIYARLFHRVDSSMALHNRSKIRDTNNITIDQSIIILLCCDLITYKL